MIDSIGRSYNVFEGLISMLNVGILGAGGIAALSHLPEIAAVDGHARGAYLRAPGKPSALALCKRFDVPRFSTELVRRCWLTMRLTPSSSRCRIPCMPRLGLAVLERGHAPVHAEAALYATIG